MVEVEKNFCTYIKEQIVDEKEAGTLYDRVIEVLDATPTVSEHARLVIVPKDKELLKALLQKIATDEKSHFALLQVIDQTVCGSSY